MAQTGYTPISIYYSATAAAAPTAGNLVAGELAINTADGKLFYKDSSGVVQTLATKDATSGSFTNLAYTGTLTGGTGVVNLGSGQFYKDASGNIGLGTSSPTVYVANDKVLQISAGANGGAIRISNTTTGANGGWLGYQLGLDSYLSNVSAGALVFATSNQEKMRIDSSGNVGIGTSSPSTYGDLAVYRSNSTNATIAVSQNTATTNFGAKFSAQYGATEISSYGYYWNGAFFISKAGFYGTLTFNDLNASNAERMRIDSSGNLLVGGTVSVGKTSSIQASAGGYCFGSNAANNAGTYYHFQFTEGGTLRGQITSNGTLTTYSTTSDYRLKENVIPMTGALEKVAKLKPVIYDWVSNKFKGQGFIAHELAEIVPDCVTGEKDAVDEDGKPVYQCIDTSFLIATLTAAIQELKAEVDLLKGAK